MPPGSFRVYSGTGDIGWLLAAYSCTAVQPWLDRFPRSVRVWPGSERRPQQDSNLRSRLRRPLLSPLSYGGCATPKGTSRKSARTRRGTVGNHRPEAEARQAFQDMRTLRLTWCAGWFSYALGGAQRESVACGNGIPKTHERLFVPGRLRSIFRPGIVFARGLHCAAGGFPLFRPVEEVIIGVAGEVICLNQVALQGRAVRELPCIQVDCLTVFRSVSLRNCRYRGDGAADLITLANIFERRGQGTPGFRAGIQEVVYLCGLRGCFRACARAGLDRRGCSGRQRQPDES